MSGSIRRRVGLIVVASIAPVLAGGAYLSYRHTADAVRGRFDSDLAATARVLADLAEYDEEGYELEIAPSTARLLDGDEAVRVEAWQPDGRRLYRSPSLGDADLPQPGPAAGTVQVADGELPGGGDARVATLRFVPRSDVDAGGGGSAAPMALSVARSTAGMDAMLDRLALWFAGVGAALVLVCAWLVSRATGVGLRPLSRMAGDIAAIDAAALDRRLPAGDAPSEVRPVVNKLNELLARLEESFTRERRFTADAAHELRTPLAVLRAEVEVALGAQRQAADYREVLSGTLATIEEASRMVNALLLLARADAGRLRARSQPVNLGELVTAAWDRARPVAEGRDLRFDADVPDGATVERRPGFDEDHRRQPAGQRRAPRQRGRTGARARGARARPDPRGREQRQRAGTRRRRSDVRSLLAARRRPHRQRPQRPGPGGGARRRRRARHDRRSQPARRPAGHRPQ